MKKIAIIGAGGFGRELKGLIDDINKVNSIYEFVGYYEDNKVKGEKINGYPVLGTIEDLNKIDQKINIVLGIGDPKVKFKIISKINNPLITFPVLVHPSCIVGTDEVTIGAGTVICAGTIITCNIIIEKFVTFNLMCTVGHDTVIKEFSSFMPSINISGEVVVGKYVYVGTGAKIINQLQIGDRTIVGAGAVVSKSLPADCTAVGIPAKAIKTNEAW